MSRHPALADNGYQLLSHVFTVAEMEECCLAIETWMSDERAGLRTREGAVFGARNVLQEFPWAQTCWHRPQLLEYLRGELGDGFGLVRGLYFDKPPERSWSLPWHQDLTIAVRPIPEAWPDVRFEKPTVKQGVLHLEAPAELLARMLALRIHLDPVTTENGALQVVAGSHRAGKGLQLQEDQVRTIYADAGDVLAMRPLLVHGSLSSTAGTTQHRRILHLEFAAVPEFSSAWQWHEFYPAPLSSSCA